VSKQESSVENRKETAFVASGFARVVAVRDNLLRIRADAGALTKNEVVYVCVGEERLRAEVLRILGRTADIQVFEDTTGVKVGDRVELTGELLSVTLGPGLLGQVYDGLQNPLAVLAAEHGFFLPRGVYIDPLNRQHRWAFEPSVTVGAKLRAGDVVGSVQETHFRHRIMIPFNEPGQVEVTWIQGGDFSIDQAVCRIIDAKGNERDITLSQRWPVRRPIPGHMLTTRIAERLFPLEPLTTTTRIIDTFFPIARGGTACIPGPFGAGKTVLQGLMARYASVDIVIIVACGERAGEVVETIAEFPHMQDPRTGGSLMDRTIIICNTSSMPVAAREASIYTGITLGEYYRQMGYNVLLLADSTSRWAQAMRETSGRMEEIPGEEAFPAYLDSSIKGLSNGRACSRWRMVRAASPSSARCRPRAATSRSPSPSPRWARSRHFSAFPTTGPTSASIPPSIRSFPGRATSSSWSPTSRKTSSPAGTGRWRHSWACCGAARPSAR